MTKNYKFLKNGYKSVEQSRESFFKNIFKIEAGVNYILRKI